MEMISIRDGEIYKSEIEDYCRWVGHVGKIYVRTPAHKKRHSHIFEARLLIIDDMFWDNSSYPFIFDEDYIKLRFTTRNTLEMIKANLFMQDHKN